MYAMIMGIICDERQNIEHIIQMQIDCHEDTTPLERYVDNDAVLQSRCCTASDIASR